MQNVLLRFHSDGDSCSGHDAGNLTLTRSAGAQTRCSWLIGSRFWVSIVAEGEDGILCSK